MSSSLRSFSWFRRWCSYSTFQGCIFICYPMDWEGIPLVSHWFSKRLYYCNTINFFTLHVCSSFAHSILDTLSMKSIHQIGSGCYNLIIIGCIITFKGAYTRWKINRRDCYVFTKLILQQSTNDRRKRCQILLTVRLWRAGQPNIFGIFADDEIYTSDLKG